MELLVNDLSVHEQFYDISEFGAALHRLIQMRDIAQRFGRQLECNKGFTSRSPRQDMSMQQAIRHSCSRDQRRAIMSWITSSGPFWDDLRKHGEDEYLECRSEIVTDYAVGEAAFRKLHGTDCSLVSVRPSDWEISPIEVVWRRDDNGLEDQYTSVDNWLDAASLEGALQDKQEPVRSWTELIESSKRRFTSLTFAGNCIDRLEGVPFKVSSANRLCVLLNILDQIARAVSPKGRYTSESRRLYEEYFKGGKSWFSDSSTQEKNLFRKELKFDHPDSQGDTLFCPWHGKENYLTLRLHFSWPIKAGQPLYIVYIGPKLTKK